MTTYEKVCLKWGNFSENLTGTFSGLRDNSDFSDVTVMCDEDEQIQAHRVILAACSPFFSSILKKIKLPHPIIYMRGLKAKDLVALMDFIYHGETNIYQEDLDGFIALAEELQLKGLNSSSDNEQKTEAKNTMNNCENKVAIRKERKTFRNIQNKVYVKNETTELGYQEENLSENSSLVPADARKTMVSVKSTMEDVKAKISSMMEKLSEGSYKWKCTVCGKLAKDRSNMVRHIESHIDGVSYPCSQCDNISRSRAGLQVHISRNHTCSSKH